MLKNKKENQKKMTRVNWINLSNSKKIKINYKTQFSINLMLNDGIEKKNQLKKDTKNNMS
jgi:hypothetical protein